MGTKHDMSYEETVEFIKGLPMTWMPALLLELAQAAYDKKCFRPFGASTIIKNMETKNMRINMQEAPDAPTDRRD